MPEVLPGQTLEGTSGLLSSWFRLRTRLLGTFAGGGHATTNLHRFRVFCAVAQAGSFAAPSERLFISQPAMSHQIAALERQLGVRLLERSA